VQHASDTAEMKERLDRFVSTTKASIYVECTRLMTCVKYWGQSSSHFLIQAIFVHFFNRSKEFFVTK
jgi:hypothetical protein